MCNILLDIQKNIQGMSVLLSVQKMVVKRVWDMMKKGWLNIYLCFACLSSFLRRFSSFCCSLSAFSRASFSRSCCNSSRCMRTSSSSSFIFSCSCLSFFELFLLEILSISLMNPPAPIKPRIINVNNIMYVPII
ncbi:hypothetical protein BACCELL_00456 [Bacteroides cellulosilyticus DSM 14838]|uniref:Uncharacterized protein n=1 Tax=Bacteroides cellulosilyticus DSM 14838 TaxID=537012 RepID=E2N861_9BACE|nr:hypothetical protein BACCELL_00456 [Bacteroides cellulosilyticus DSM 14838]